MALVKGESLFIITGCSRGLGKALLEQLQFLPENRIIGISRSKLPTTPNFESIPLDLSKTDELINNLGAIFPFGGFRKVTLVNNAGWIGEIAPMGRLDPEKLARVYRLNAIAPAILTNAFIERYGAHPCKKVIVNISSGAANKAVDGWSGYCATKSAVNQMTLVAAEESRIIGHGIDFFALSPGIIDTAMQEEIRSSSKDNFSNIEKFKGFKSKGELSSANEIAQKLIYLVEHPDRFDGVLQDVRDFAIH